MDENHKLCKRFEQGYFLTFQIFSSNQQKHWIIRKHEFEYFVSYFRLVRFCLQLNQIKVKDWEQDRILVEAYDDTRTTF